MFIVVHIMAILKYYVFDHVQINYNTYSQRI